MDNHILLNLALNDNTLYKTMCCVTKELYNLSKTYHYRLLAPKYCISIKMIIINDDYYIVLSNLIGGIHPSYSLMTSNLNLVEEIIKTFLDINEFKEYEYRYQFDEKIIIFYYFFYAYLYHQNKNLYNIYEYSKMFKDNDDYKQKAINKAYKLHNNFPSFKLNYRANNIHGIF